MGNLPEIKSILSYLILSLLVCILYFIHYFLTKIKYITTKGTSVGIFFSKKIRFYKAIKIIDFFFLYYFAYIYI